MALYVPNPDAPPVEELIEALGAELASRYAGAEDELIREIAKRAARDLELQALLPDVPVGHGLTAAARIRQNRILAEIAAHRARAIRDLQFLAAKIVADLRNEELAKQLLELAAREGEAAAAAQLGFARNIPKPTLAIPFLGSRTGISTMTLTGTAAQAVAALVLSLDSRLEALNQRLTRYPQDAYQRIVSLFSPTTILGVTTSRVQQAQTVARFLAEGITGFVDRGGRRWTIGAYAEMAGRTSVNRAYNDASIWRMQQSGIGLVSIVGGSDACRQCAEWFGKILSTDGSPSGPRVLPAANSDKSVIVDVVGSLDQARSAGWNHPNCRCRAVAYLPGLSIAGARTTYDPVAEAQRERQRLLERRIRAAKRDEASSLDDVSRQDAHRDVLDAQKRMREFLAETGRNRSNYREQLHFADGK